MIPVSVNGASPIGAPQQEIPPAKPEASDVQEFQKLYWGEGQDGSGAVDPTLDLRIPLEIEPTSPSVFLKSMEKMMEVNGKAAILKENLIELVRNGGNLTEAELFKVQVAVGDATTSLSVFHAFEKKSEEGVKMLMTGQ